jgi:hypothetical protein
MSNKIIPISIEKFAAYLDNNLSIDEMAQIDNAINANGNLQELISMNDAIDICSIENEFELPEEILSGSFEIPNIDHKNSDALEHALDVFENIFHQGGDSSMDDYDTLSHEQPLIDKMMNTEETFRPGFFGEMSSIQQNHPDTCAIKAQQIILNEFNIPCTEDQLVKYSAEHGWYKGNGTAMSDVGKLLVDGGVPCTQQVNADAFDLVNELSQGHKIIVGVDANELWNNNSIRGKFSNWYNDFFHGNTPNHAVIVAGIDTTDPNNIQVLVTDPGTGEYHRAYPMDQFMDAWSDSNCFMVSTDVAAPQTLPLMANFDYAVGHIDSVAGVDYAEFQVFYDISHGVPFHYMDVNGQMLNPMSSFMDAYLDYAHDDIMFSEIFNHGHYMFNDYIDQDLVTAQLHDSFDFGMTQIGFDMNNDWIHYAEVNGIAEMTNQDYSNFLDQSIHDFQAMGDSDSVTYCEQQHMMLDYCDENGLDFFDTFLDY